MSWAVSAGCPVTIDDMKALGRVVGNERNDEVPPPDRLLADTVDGDADGQSNWDLTELQHFGAIYARARL